MTFIWPLEKMHLGHFSFYRGELNPNVVHKGTLKSDFLIFICSFREIVVVPADV